MDLYFKEREPPILVGRLLSELMEHPRELRHGFTLSRFLDLRADEFIQLVDKSHRGVVVCVAAE